MPSPELTGGAGFTFEDAAAACYLAALVGGTTGSGKSEFLQAWVLGLAHRYSPDRLTFLFVDYKGGAAFARCTDLPHSVGMVTDLSDHLVRRALRPEHALLLRDAQVDVVVGVIVDEALDDLFGRPVRERRADRARVVEAQRARARQLDRAADPPAAAGGRDAA